MPTDRLRELRTLVAILDTGNLASAARRLGRSAASVTRDLGDLERRLGTTLIDRSTRSCRATPAGMRLADDARQVLASYDEAVGQVVGEDASPRGLVRITAPITFGRELVGPLLADFLKAYDQMSVELHLTDRMVDLLDEDVDIAVRIGALSDSGLVARRVGELREIAVASPAYLRSRGEPAHPAELIRHETVHHAPPGSAAEWTFSDASGRPLKVPVRPRFIVNQPEAAIAAARRGHGIVRALQHQVFEDLREGDLVVVLEGYEPAARPIHLVWLRSRLAWRRVRLLSDWLVEGLALPRA